MDGILYKGCLPLKIRRPKDYVPLNDGKNRQYHVPGIVSTQVEDGPNKIFIGNLPPGLNDLEVKEFLSAYGELKAFHMVKDIGTGMTKGYAFFTYVNPDVTDEACKGLNGIELGGKKLVCQRANIGAKPNAAAVTELLGGVMGGGMMGLGGLGMIQGMASINAAALALQTTGLNAVGATKILVLQNMVSIDELKDDNEYKEILEEVRDELQNHGRVEKVVIPRPAEGKVKGLGKIFIKFASVDDAQRAERNVSGRKFGERTVLTRYLKENDFAKGEFDE
mmetsp:Transcript_4549/g.6801  ORF Transcript_4549/g.6801 Transcript_4549/m.6801 type:complete len:279 (-) Transcript_4549:3-839(-)